MNKEWKQTERHVSFQRAMMIEKQMRMNFIWFVVSCWLDQWKTILATLLADVIINH